MGRGSSFFGSYEMVRSQMGGAVLNDGLDELAFKRRGALVSGVVPLSVRI